MAAAGDASGPAPLLPPPSHQPGAAETGGPPSAARGPGSPAMSILGATLAAGRLPGSDLPARVGTLTLAGQRNGGAAAAERDWGQAGGVASAEHGAEMPGATARPGGAGAMSSVPGACRDLAKQVEQLMGHEEAACCAVWSPSGRNAVTAAADGMHPPLHTGHCPLHASGNAPPASFSQQQIPTGSGWCVTHGEYIGCGHNASVKKLALARSGSNAALY